MLYIKVSGRPGLLNGLIKNGVFRDIFGVAGMKNKMMPYFSFSIILSVLLHITILTTFPFFKGFLSVVPLVRNVMVLELQDGIESRKTAVRVSSVLSLREKESGKEGPEERTVLKEVQWRGQEDQNEDDKVPNLESSSNPQMSAVNDQKPEEISCARTENVVAKIGELEVKEKGLQIARAERERFSYDIYWLGIQVGNAYLEAVDNNGLLKITSHANSSAIISAFYKVDDYAESLIREGIPVNFRIRQHEGKYKSDKETVFDASNKNVMFFNYLKGTKNEHSIPPGITWDVISGFYYLRTQPLDIGKTVYVNIFDSNKFYRAEVNVLRREKIEVQGIGEVNTVIVRPELKTEGLFQKKGDVLIWITDDEKRIPVRVETKVPVGDVVAKLRDFVMK